MPARDKGKFDLRGASILGLAVGLNGAAAGLLTRGTISIFYLGLIPGPVAPDLAILFAAGFGGFVSGFVGAVLWKWVEYARDPQAHSEV